MTIKCNLCGYESENGRKMHGHLMMAHHDEYKAENYNIEKFTTGFKRKEFPAVKVKKKPAKEIPLIEERPINLRLLNKSKQIELDAYNEGHRYIDPDTMIAYTLEEVKEEGWL